MRRSAGAVAALALLVPGAVLAAEAPANLEFLRQYSETYRFTLGRPASVSVAPDGKALFLRSGPRSFVRDLWSFDPATGTESVLATAAGLLAGAAETLSTEERAQRERKRLAARGIAEFELSRDGAIVLIPLSGRLFLLDRKSGASRELAAGVGSADEARLSPDGARIAFVRDGDLHALEIASGRERRLTRREDEHVTYGLAEFIAEEEMARHQGHWWSPDSRRILFQRTDTRGVERFHIADPAHPERPAESWPYPRPGHANAEVRLGIVDAAGGSVTWVTWDARRYPYVARVSWERSSPPAILVQNREQTEERLLAVDPQTGRTSPLLVERDAAWLNLHPRIPAWLEDGSGFLWITERRGGPQLEHYDRRGKRLRVLTPLRLNLREFVHADPARGLAWALAGEEPGEEHLYEIPLDPRRGGPRRLTTEPGVYRAWFPVAGAQRYALERKTLEGAWRHEIHDGAGKPLGTLRSVAEEPPFLPAVECVTLPGPRALRAAIVRPRAFRRGERYPVLVHVYGGPLSQMVTADRRGYLLDQWTADQGYVVVRLDGRGTPARGRAWERTIRGDLISAPLEDHVHGLEELFRTHPEMDAGRVGVWGWSFGGTFAAMAVMRHPEVFHTAVAGAPVVNWLNYDTHYTERYLGIPPAAEAAYRRSSPVSYARNLRRPLLLIHGTADDNVYFVHSLELCDALTQAGVACELLPLIGRTHMVSDANATARLYTRILEHFAKTLRPREPEVATGNGAR